MIEANENNILFGKCFPISIIEHSSVEVCSETQLDTATCDTEWFSFIWLHCHRHKTHCFKIAKRLQP
jgi:hypothetical protein